MKYRDLVTEVLSKNITQESLGDYLGVTRQTVAKISRGDYVKLSIDSVKRIEALINRNYEEIQEIISIDKFVKDIFQNIIKGDEKYINRAYEGFKYMHYWINDDKFTSQRKYHEFYFGHMNNFYPRFNQAALFMRDTLNRQKYPLVTYQIDYKNRKVTDFCIKAFVKEHDKFEYDTKNIMFPITFEQFFSYLQEKVKPKPRFLIYKDYLDDDWAFMLSELKNHWILKEEVYDLSRLLNFLENQQNYYGPLLEDALMNFNIKFDENKLFMDCHYRAEIIVELINMISLEKIHRKKHDKTGLLFDSHGFKRDNKFVRDERRKLKRR